MQSASLFSISYISHTVPLNYQLIVHAVVQKLINLLTNLLGINCVLTINY